MNKTVLNESTPILAQASGFCPRRVQNQRQMGKCNFISFAVIGLIDLFIQKNVIGMCSWKSLGIYETELDNVG